MENYKVYICLSFSFLCLLVFQAPAAITTYTTANGQLRISHNTSDEGLYYNCDANEIAQNVQIIRTDVNTYHTVYHSEPKKHAFRDDFAKIIK